MEDKVFALPPLNPPFPELLFLFVDFKMTCVCVCVCCGETVFLLVVREKEENCSLS